ncbi:hypothetical protein PVAND_006003 [Polypedilum vanderplanki]|uniref:Uncharacterized protein n=1 Tax=Polypedilum vanderplanki TaxID=319348 RepID=A0A9J6C2A5_POLVA|nr:hypothetical protein PVAND_006003 [Polypedilum vanderplanki]
MTEKVETVANQGGQEDKNDGDHSQTDLTQLELDIIKQIEYYFGESNLRRDKFLNSKIAEDKDGWVPISVLLTFNRLKALTEDANVIAESVDKSSNGLVQVSEDKQKIRRHPENPLPEFNEERRKELQARTAYAKGFPLDSTMNTLLEYFKNNFDKVENVMMRKYYCPKTKVYLFKGSVYVLFSNKENAEEFVQRPDLKYGEKDLLRYMQKDYLEKKKTEKSKYDKKQKKKEEDKDEIVLPKNAVIHFTGVEGDIMREDIKKRVLEIDPSLVIAFVHFERGAKEGQLRFSKEDDGKKFLEKLENGKMKLKELELTMSLVEGEQEETFLKEAIEDMRKARQRGQQKNNKGRKGGGKNDRKRKHENESEDVPTKQTKVDEEPSVVTVAE